MSMIGKKVKVTFNDRWPIAAATYTYEGHDDNGYWLRRKDGVQRHLPRDVVAEIVPVEEEIDEERY